jgi:ArsR family transcriptional regulator, arsenate/arsenite/antimonite-responsive transcriptional repressor
MSSETFAGFLPSATLPLPAYASWLAALRPAPRFSTNIEIHLDRGAIEHHLISMKVERTAKQLEALGNATRLQVYRSLVRAGDAGLAVGRLQEKLKIPASTLSHHLHRLILTGLVQQERQGTTLICRANYPAMRNLIGFLVDECCADASSGAESTDAAA